MSNAKTKRLNESDKPAINFGIADNQHKLILPQNTTANLAQITPKEIGSLAYDTTLNQVVANMGSGFSPVGGGSSGANTSLSNLTSPTALNQDLLPASDVFTNLGSTTKRLSAVYLSTLRNGNNNAVLVNDNTFLQVGANAVPLRFNDPSLAGASNGNVWALSDQTTGQGHWIPVSGGTPTGNPNTVSFFGSGGTLTDSLFFSFDATPQALKFGNSVSTGDILVTGDSSLAFGNSDGAGSAIIAGGLGDITHGQAVGGGTLITNGTGTDGNYAGGYVTDTSIILSRNSSLVQGQSINAGTISAVGNGGAIVGMADGGTLFVNSDASIIHGKATGGGIITTTGIASTAFGSVDVGTMTASGNGSLAAGNIEVNGFIRATNKSSVALGYTNGDPTTGLNSSAQGSFALGYAAGAASSLTATRNGSMSRGYANNGGTIQTGGAGTGALAQGTANGAFGTTIVAGGSGSLASGLANNVGAIRATGGGSFAGGLSNDVNAVTLISGTAAIGYGLGLTASSFASATFGQFGANNGDAGTWISTDPLLVLGNGTSNTSTSTAFQIDKDGKAYLTGAQSNSAVRSISASDSLSDRTDHSLFVDTVAASGAVVVTFPAGIPGLEYLVKDIGNNASVHNITFAATGGDVVGVNASITTNSGSRHFQYFNGTWYVIAGI